jgi:hypothetical protein
MPQAGFFIKDQAKKLVVNSGITTLVMWLIIAVIQFAGDTFFLYVSWLLPLFC